MCVLSRKVIQELTINILRLINSKSNLMQYNGKNYDNFFYEFFLNGMIFIRFKI